MNFNVSEGVLRLVPDDQLIPDAIAFHLAELTRRKAHKRDMYMDWHFDEQKRGIFDNYDNQGWGEIPEVQFPLLVRWSIESFDHDRSRMKVFPSLIDEALSSDELMIRLISDELAEVGFKEKIVAVPSLVVVPLLPAIDRQEPYYCLAYEATEHLAQYVLDITRILEGLKSKSSAE